MNTQTSVDQFMTLYPTTATPQMNALDALKVMRKGKFRHLPIIENHEIVGIVSERDLIRIESVIETTNLSLEQVMIRNPFIARIGTSLNQVAKAMATEKYGCTIVVNEKNNVVGIFTTTDGMRLLATLIDSDPNSQFGDSSIEEYFDWVPRSECLD